MLMRRRHPSTYLVQVEGPSQNPKAVSRESGAPVSAMPATGADIVVGVNGTPASWDALLWAAAEAAATRASLRIVHVLIEPRPIHAGTWTWLQEEEYAMASGQRLLVRSKAAVRRIEPDLVVSCHLEAGATVARALATAGAGGSMIVIGHPDVMSKHRFLRRDHLAALVRRADGPVAMVTLTERPAGRFSGQVILVRSAETGAAATSYARAAARRRGAYLCGYWANPTAHLSYPGAALLVFSSHGHYTRLSRQARQALRDSSTSTVVVVPERGTGPSTWFATGSCLDAGDTDNS